MTYYNEGYTAQRTEDYTTAIENFTKAFYWDETNVDALFGLAEVYRKSEDTENAIATYDKVIELFPDTERARKSQQNRDMLAGTQG